VNNIVRRQFIFVKIYNIYIYVYKKDNSHNILKPGRKFPRRTFSTDNIIIRVSCTMTRITIWSYVSVLYDNTRSRLIYCNVIIIIIESGVGGDDTGLL